MTLLYADTSAILRSYLVDEPDHAALRRLLREGPDPVVTSELARVEFAGALQAAHRAERLKRPATVMARFDADCQPDGPVALLRLEPRDVVAEAYRLVTDHPVRTLDALHLATALMAERALAGEDGFSLVTRDDTQAAAAEAEGLTVL